VKDRFPFVDSQSSSFAERVKGVQNRAEATAEQVKSLIDAYHAVDGPSLTRFLASRGTCTSDPALGFLQRLDNAVTLFASAADPALKTPTVVLDMLPEFRLGSNPGTGGDQIAEWTLEVGSRSVRDPIAAPAAAVPWTYGDKVSLVIRFARDSPAVPAPGAGVLLRGTSSDGRTVRFDFTGNWAMFQLLLARSISNESDALLLRDVTPTVLAVDVPVQPDPTKPPVTNSATVSSFELFMRLGTFQRGKTEALTVGMLPTQAPATVTCLGI
jgi:hypothetical protein